MKKDLLHTPEGVRDIYSTECVEKKIIENKLHDVCRLYGYNDIQTPSIEYFDVFSKERGSVPSNEMFKLFDRYGNTLVLRPDMTPSIARAAAKYRIIFFLLNSAMSAIHLLMSASIIRAD